MRKAQVDIIFWGAFVIGLIIIAPILFKIVTVSMEGFSQGLNELNNNSANQVTYVEHKFTGFFDFVVLFIFIINTILLLIPAFLVAVNPIFIILFVFVCFFTFFFLPPIIQSAQGIWGGMADISTGADITQYLPITQFLLNWYPLVMLAIMIILGIIMYAKLRSVKVAY